LLRGRQTWHVDHAAYIARARRFREKEPRGAAGRRRRGLHRAPARGCSAGQRVACCAGGYRVWNTV